MHDALGRRMTKQQATAANAQLAKITQDIAETIQREGNVKAVFGEPVQLETHVVIPVAAIHMSLGGGAGGGGLNKGVKEKLTPFGLGGGLGLEVHAAPIGFICESAQEVKFTPIAREPTTKEEHNPNSFVGRILHEIEKRSAKTQRRHN